MVPDERAGGTVRRSEGRSGKRAWRSLGGGPLTEAPTAVAADPAALRSRAGGDAGVGGLEAVGAVRTQRHRHRQAGGGTPGIRHRTADRRPSSNPTALQATRSTRHRAGRSRPR